MNTSKKSKAVCDQVMQARRGVALGGTDEVAIAKGH